MPELLYNALYGLGGAGAGGFAIWRYFKGAMNVDALDSKAQAIIKNLQDMLRAEWEKNQRLSEAVESVSKERNEAVQAMGKLEGQVEALTGQVNMLKSEVQRLEAQSTRLESQNAELLNEMRQIRAHINRHGVVPA